MKHEQVAPSRLVTQPHLPSDESAFAAAVTPHCSPSPNRVHSPGDPNLLSWFHDGKTSYVVDLDFGGFPDVAHSKHINGRVIPDNALD